MKTSRIFLLALMGCTSFVFSQSYSGTLTHTNGYFTMEPYNSSYDDGSAARLFYDGNNKRIRFWNTDSGTSFTHIDVGNVDANGNLEAAGNITASGSLGIGVTSPTAKLHFKDGDQEIRFLTGSSTSRYRLDVGVNDNGINFENNSAIRGFVFSNINGNLFNISSNGNVGIGTINPDGWKLAVKGKIRAEEIKVETGWSDFVFEKNYNLPTLEEVEEHIKNKGHLKDIPSAEEVAENGILLGEMDSKLLQKIEELTLYVIDINKRVEQLQTENTELKKKLELE